MERKHAFTMVELLVAISIMLILACLLMAALTMAIGAAKSTACITNLSQLGKAMQLYAADNEEYIPPYFLDSGVRGGIKYQAQPGLLKKAYMLYGAADEQFYCPLDADAKKESTNSPRLDHRVLSYNDAITVYMLGAQNVPYLKLTLSAIPRPTESVYLWDDAWSTSANHGLSPHGDRRNALFFDGRVKSRSLNAPCAYPGQQKSCPEE